MGSKRVGQDLANEKQQQKKGNNCTLRLMQKKNKGDAKIDHSTK